MHPKKIHRFSISDIKKFLQARMLEGWWYIKVHVYYLDVSHAPDFLDWSTDLSIPKIFYQYLFLDR